VPLRDLLSRHALREARREGITLAEIEDTYVSPDEVRGSTHDDVREIRTRHFGLTSIEVVVDTIDGRVVTVWRKQVGR
jgi:hypothetical protein